MCVILKMEVIMRLRNVKNKEEILQSCSLLVQNPQTYRGHWHELFANDQPIYLEIGMGKGDFIIQNAKLHPDINYIGIEKFDSVLARAIPKIPIDLKNLRIIRMDARFIEDVFDHEISQIYLNFSDPWPKKRHAFRRLTSPEFLARYDRIFQEEKRIEMKTDNAALFTYSIETLSQKGYGLFEVYLDYHEQVENIIMSEYEQRFVQRGQKVFHLFAKNR